MSKTGFIINTDDGDNSDIGDLLVRRDYFTEGGLWGWGYNYSGQLGDNTGTNKSSPVQTIARGTNWKQASCGYRHASFTKTDGTLWTCGDNTFGQLGNNNAAASPIQTLCGGTNWRRVSCGVYHTSAIKTDGTLWGWGNNNDCQLGRSLYSPVSPVQTICGGNNWSQVSCGGYYTSAIKTDGTLWAWGSNNYGQLGDNSQLLRSSPTQTVCGGNNWKSVAAGYYHISAIKIDGTLWTWGGNDSGQLGDNSLTWRSSPVQTIAGGNNWKQVSAGYYNTSAIKTDGTLWVWGSNGYGQLGNNSTTYRMSPVQTISGGSNWKQVFSGSSHTAAIKTDGTLWTWGYDGTGVLGDNSTNHKSSPIQTIAGGTNWKQISIDSKSNIMFAIKDDIS